VADFKALSPFLSGFTPYFDLACLPSWMLRWHPIRRYYQSARTSPGSS